MRILGLEDYPRDTDLEGHQAKEYLERVLRQLRRITEPGDVLSVGGNVSFIGSRSMGRAFCPGPSKIPQPEDYGFRLVRCPKETFESHESLWVRV